MTDRTAELEKIVNYGMASHDAGTVAQACREVLDRLRVAAKDRSDPEPDDTDESYARLWRLGIQAMALLGGQAESSLTTVADYDHEKYGPMLGVSDEGSATKAIRQGALAAPKCQVLGRDCAPLTVGVAHDAERLGGVGEVVVGPDEYATIRLACRDRILTTTNVGTRVIIRSFLPPPVVRIARGKEADAEEMERKLAREFAPFLHTPNRHARGQTVFIQFDKVFATRHRAPILKRLIRAVAGGSFANPKLHKLSLLIRPTGARRIQQVHEAIDLAHRAGVAEVAIDSRTRTSAQSVGLLNDFEPNELAVLLQTAAAKGVTLICRSRVDPQTTARHVWTGLSVARNMGLELGKYGLVPLTFEEQREVIARIQYWLPHWCAAPVFYVDHPLVTKLDVFDESRLAKGIRIWLEMVAKLRVRVVLIDTAEKSQHRRLLKDTDDDATGFLTAKEIAAATGFGHQKGVKVLWAGGITLPQAFTLGRLGVFGMYVTSSAAVPVAVSGSYRRDRALAAGREPDRASVARVKLLIEAGFLSGRLEASADAGNPGELATLANELAIAKEGEESAALESTLHSRLVPLWRKHLALDES